MTDAELHQTYTEAREACAKLYAMVTEKQAQWRDDPIRAYTFAIAGMKGADLMSALTSFRGALLEMRGAFKDNI